jgi:hypothetical protein
MKNKKIKKLKKIAEIISAQMAVEKFRIRKDEEKIDYYKYDADVSKKTEELILGLLPHNDGVHISFVDKEFRVSVQDITSIKKQQQNTSPKYSDENYLEIIVNKSGFSINFSYSKRTNYIDNQMFDKLIGPVKNRVKEVNRENFVEIWHKVMHESGLIRNTNLEQLLQ